MLEERRTACTEQLENVKVQLESAKEQVARPFPQEEELKTKSARLDELNILLDMDKKDNEVLDDGEISEEDAERNQPQKKDRGIGFERYGIPREFSFCAAPMEFQEADPRL